MPKTGKKTPKGKGSKGDKTAKDEPEKEEAPPVPQCGKDRIEFEGGQVYEGEWKMTEEKKIRHGKGREIITDKKELYTGAWVEGQMSGSGRYEFEDGSWYEGEWDTGLFQGRGTFCWASGAKYIGDWSHNKMHGNGCFVDKKGTRFQGKFHNDSYQMDDASWQYMTP